MAEGRRDCLSIPEGSVHRCGFREIREQDKETCGGGRREEKLATSYLRRKDQDLNRETRRTPGGVCPGTPASQGHSETRDSPGVI